MRSGLAGETQLSSLPSLSSSSLIAVSFWLELWMTMRGLEASAVYVSLAMTVVSAETLEDDLTLVESVVVCCRRKIVVDASSSTYWQRVLARVGVRLGFSSLAVPAPALQAVRSERRRQQQSLCLRKDFVRTRTVDSASTSHAPSHTLHTHHHHTPHTTTDTLLL